jgi:hypothetical protein
VCHFFILVAVFFSLFFVFLFKGKFQPSVFPLMWGFMSRRKQEKRKEKETLSS